MITVSDTTAITTLVKVERIDVLDALFGSVLIPSAVERELKAHHPFLPACCEVRPVTQSERLTRLLGHADHGEAEAICLAVEVGATVLLIDDKKGRRLAEAEGLRCLGLPALVLAANRRGLIRSVREFFDLLERKGNFCLTSRVRSELLREAGE